MAEQQLQASGQEQDCQVDRISLLPDEILLSILNLLNMKEATATSILSRGWRYLRIWMRKLDFDCEFNPCKRKKQHQEFERSYYIKWVNDIIAMHKGSTLEKFRIVCKLDQLNQCTINKWVSFALSREVEKLELDLTGPEEFPGHCDYYFCHRYNLDKFKFLKKLKIKYVSMSGDLVKDLMKKCRHLQHLSLARSDISFVEIINPSPSFKCLEISRCDRIKSFVIRNSDIVTLKVIAMGRFDHVVLENVPLLTEIWAGIDGVSYGIKYVLSMFVSLFPQLHLLKLCVVNRFLLEEGNGEFYETAVLSNLKQLVVVDNVIPPKTMLTLIKASPQLDRLVLEFQNGKRCLSCKNQTDIHPSIKTFKIKISNEYPCLKEIQALGCCDMYDVFTKLYYLAKYGLPLDNIVVDPREMDPFRIATTWGWDYIPQHKPKTRSRILGAFRKYACFFQNK